LLYWASEPLPKRMLREVMRVMRPLAQESDRALADALRHGHVMLHQAMAPCGTWGWTLFHESLRQHLGQTQTIVGTRTEVQQALLQWCARWAEHRDPYALRHYATHLRELGREQELYRLARSESFAQAQTEVLTNEPDASLGTLHEALRAAIARDDAAAMAEYSLSHARRSLRIRSESPL